MRKLILLFAATLLLAPFTTAESEAYDYTFTVTSSTQTKGYCTLSLDDAPLLSTYIVNHQASGSTPKHGGMLYVYCYPAPSVPGSISESLGPVSINKIKKTVTCDIACRLHPAICREATDYNFNCTLKESN
ncbi:MAG: hypothetical protein M0009_10745 [Deltaproteobacteria bacterium]|nr:hypothetical protein [Deltaproteobacteria bacterium]